MLKIRSFRARTPQTPGFRGEAAEGAGRGVRSARLRALTSRGPQLGHQAGRAAGAGRAGDPRPGAELTSRRAARLWAAPRPAAPAPATAGARRRGAPGDPGPGSGTQAWPGAAPAHHVGAAWARWRPETPGARSESGPRGCGRLAGGRRRKLPEAWWQPGRSRGGGTRERIRGALADPGADSGPTRAAGAQRLREGRGARLDTR